MSIEAVIAMQGCARIGATHSIVLGGFSAKSFHERISDAGATAVVTADGQMRGSKEIALKPAIDEALAMGGCEGVKNVVVYKRTGSATSGGTIWCRTSPTHANRSGSTPSTRCSSFIPPARPASPKEHNIPAPAIYRPPCSPGDIGYFLVVIRTTAAFGLAKKSNDRHALTKIRRLTTATQCIPAPHCTMAVTGAQSAVISGFNRGTRQ